MSRSSIATTTHLSGRLVEAYRRGTAPHPHPGRRGELADGVRPRRRASTPSGSRRQLGTVSEHLDDGVATAPSLVGPRPFVLPPVPAGRPRQVPRSLLVGALDGASRMRRGRRCARGTSTSVVRCSARGRRAGNCRRTQGYRPPAAAGRRSDGTAGNRWGSADWDHPLPTATATSRRRRRSIVVDLELHFLPSSTPTATVSTSIQLDRAHSPRARPDRHAAAGRSVTARSVTTSPAYPGDTWCRRPDRWQVVDGARARSVADDSRASSSRSSRRTRWQVYRHGHRHASPSAARVSRCPITCSTWSSARGVPSSSCSAAAQRSTTSRIGRRAIVVGGTGSTSRRWSTVWSRPAGSPRSPLSELDDDPASNAACRQPRWSNGNRQDRACARGHDRFRSAVLVVRAGTRRPTLSTPGMTGSAHWDLLARRIEQALLASRWTPASSTRSVRCSPAYLEQRRGPCRRRSATGAGSSTSRVRDLESSLQLAIDRTRQFGASDPLVPSRGPG